MSEDVTGAGSATPSAAASSAAPSTAATDSVATTASTPAPASGAPASTPETTAAPATDPGPIPYARFKEVNDQLAELRWAKGIDRHAISEAERIGRLYQTDRVGYLRNVIAESLADQELAPLIRSEAARVLAGARGHAAPEPPAIEPDIPVYDAQGQLVAQTFSADRVQQIVQRAIQEAIGKEVGPIKQTFAQQQAQAKAAAERQAAEKTIDAIYNRAVTLPLFKDHDKEIAEAMGEFTDAHPAEQVYLAWAKVVLPKLDQKSQAKLLGHLQTQAAGASVAPNASTSTAPPKFRNFREAAEYFETHPEQAEAMAQR
jgi:hypothetical protein